MGWGCNRHEVDAGSARWREKLDELVDREEERGFPTWGRQGEICPFCYEELVTRLAELEDERDELQTAVELSQDAYTGTQEELCEWRKMITEFTRDCKTTPIAILGRMTPEVGRIFLEQAKMEWCQGADAARDSAEVNP